MSRLNRAVAHIGFCPSSPTRRKFGWRCVSCRWPTSTSSRYRLQKPSRLRRLRGRSSSCSTASQAREPEMRLSCSTLRPAPWRIRIVSSWKYALGAIELQWSIKSIKPRRAAPTPYLRSTSTARITANRSKGTTLIERCATHETADHCHDGLPSTARLGQRPWASSARVSWRTTSTSRSMSSAWVCQLTIAGRSAVFPA